MDANFRIIRDLNLQSSIGKSEIQSVYRRKYAYIFLNLHPDRHSEFEAVTSNIFDKNFSIFYNKMEYIAIPKADFVKYFKILETKNGKVKAIKNEITVEKNRKRKRAKKEQKEKHSVEETASSSDTSTGSESD